MKKFIAGVVIGVAAGAAIMRQLYLNEKYRMGAQEFFKELEKDMGCDFDSDDDEDEDEPRLDPKHTKVNFNWAPIEKEEIEGFKSRLGTVSVGDLK